MVKEAYRFAIPPLAIGVICIFFGWKWPAAILIFLGLFVFYFFRNPERARFPPIPASSSLPRMAAWSRSSTNPSTRSWAIASASSSRFGTFTCSARRLQGASPTSSIGRANFMGAFRSAASRENEQNVIYMDTPQGTLVFKQIAGAIARRVLCWKNPGEEVARGERVGLIRFGSRVDVWLPMDARSRRQARRKQ